MELLSIHRDFEDTSPVKVKPVDFGGTAKDTFLDESNRYILKVPKRLTNCLTGPIEFMNWAHKRGHIEFNASVFFTRILQTLESAGVPFPEEWWIQPLIMKEEKYSSGYRETLGFWQTFYPIHSTRIFSPFREHVHDRDNSAFIQPHGKEALFLDWDDALMHFWMKIKDPEDYTDAKLNDLCAEIAEDIRIITSH